MNHKNYFLNYPKVSPIDQGNEVGFFRGNMFDNEYVPYKHYEFKFLMPTNDEERLMLELQKAAFELNDYVLYLDVNPTDEVIFNKYQRVRANYEHLVNEFEKQYYPLTNTKITSNNLPWSWLNNWPKGGNN